MTDHTLLRRPSIAGRANGTRPHAVIQLCGIEDVLAPAMLAVAEQVRRAVSALGVDEVSIEVVRGDSEGPATSA